MKAIVSTAYGSPDVLRVTEIARPNPSSDEVLVRIKASSVTAADGMMRRGYPYFGRLFIGLLKPRYPISGTGLAGVVESVGSDVTRFKAGDKVFGESVFGAGTNAEYACVPEKGVIESMPENLDYTEAAPVCDGALTAYNFLVSIAKMKPGQKVLIIGASGSLGTSAVQLARHYGADVTGVCSTANLEFVRSLGAHQLIDYSTTDFTRKDALYDIIFDTVGSRSYRQCRNSLTEQGVYLSPVLNIALLFQSLWTKALTRKRAKFSATGMLPMATLRTMLAEVRKLLQEGRIVTSIDRTFDLKNIVAAHRYVDTGRKKGNVVLTVDTYA